MDHFLLPAIILGLFAASLLALVIKLVAEHMLDVFKRRESDETPEFETYAPLLQRTNKNDTAADPTPIPNIIDLKLSILRKASIQRTEDLPKPIRYTALDIIDHIFTTNTTRQFEAIDILRHTGTIELVNAMSAIIPELQSVTQIPELSQLSYTGSIASRLARLIELYHKHNSCFCQAYYTSGSFNPQFLSGLAQAASPRHGDVPIETNDLWRQDEALLYMFGYSRIELLPILTKKLRFFRFARAYGGHNNDGDQLVATIVVPDLDGAANFVRKLTNDDDALASLSAHKSVYINGSNGLEPFLAFLWKDRSDDLNSIDLRLNPKNEIEIAICSGYNVFESSCELALLIEDIIGSMNLKAIDPPNHHDNDHCVCPKYYPHIFQSPIRA